MTITILIIVNVFAGLAIIVLALMQQSKGDMGSAFGGGGSQSMFGSRGSANFLSRLTATMCAVFFISSLSLAYIYAERAESNSVVSESSVIQQESEVPEINGDLPIIEGAEGAGTTGAESEVPVIESEIPVIEESSDSIQQAVEAAEQEIPAIPQQ